MPAAPDPTRVPVVLATSNGVGMGHLTRQLSVALAGADALDVTLLSLSGALPTVARAVADGRLPGAEHVRVEHCPSRTSPWQGSGAAKVAWRTAWDPYFADRLHALVAETGARVVAFDGVVPYAGLLAARRRLPGTAFVWVRRGMWRQGVGAQWLAQAEAFDLVVEPGDLGAAADAGPTAGDTGALRTAPVSLTAHVPALERAEARAALGLDLERPVLLLAPGSGAYADVGELVRRVLDHLRTVAPGWQVALTRQAIARSGADGPGGSGGDLVALRDTYPLARYLAAFDAAVGAAGYNAVHEHLAVGLPTLLVPSTAHETDDQVARTRGVVARGAALASTEEADLAGALDRLLDPAVRRELTAACAGLEAPDGATTIARELGALGRDRAPAAWPDRVGPPAWRRALTRPVARRRGTPYLTGTVTDVDPQVPVEHLRAGASPHYRALRERAARWLYA
ncbi:glycosyltransferase [Nocardioides sp. CPCC 205120]|uniref:glycosyltransferase n=1 Tax=Nocardioides sp. CPCC 205120 TaxID=3406462 RepID=UPI003B50DFD6